MLRHPLVQPCFELSEVHAVLADDELGQRVHPVQRSDCNNLLIPGIPRHEPLVAFANRASANATADRAERHATPPTEHFILSISNSRLRAPEQMWIRPASPAVGYAM